jgi:hypothetical protein
MGELTDINDLKEVTNFTDMTSYIQNPTFKWKMTNKDLIQILLQDCPYLINKTVFISNLPFSDDDIYFKPIGNDFFAIYRVSKLSEISQILRTAVSYQTQNFKYNTFKQAKLNNTTVRCAITGVIVSYNNCNVDHFKPVFCDMVRDFLKMNNIENTEIHKVRHNTNLLQEWRDFHKANAILRITTPEANRNRND